MVGVPCLPNGRLTESAALLAFLRGEGRHLLRGEAAAAFVPAATRRHGAEAQITATTLTLLLPHAPTTGVGALIFVFDRGAGATGRAGGERYDDGDDTHRVRPVWYNVASIAGWT